MHPPLCAENAQYARVPKAAPSWGGLSAVRDHATPLADKMLPNGCKLCPFEVGPWLCFEELTKSQFHKPSCPAWRPRFAKPPQK